MPPICGPMFPPVGRQSKLKQWIGQHMIKDVALLRCNELTKDLTDEELARFAVLCSPYAVVEDGLLFSEGRRASHLYLITEGQIAVQKPIRAPHARHSRRSIVAICEPGEIVGWSALVEPFVYTLTATGWKPSRLISVDAGLLRRALDSYPEMGYRLMNRLSAVISRRLRHTTEALISDREVVLSGLKV